MSSPIGGFLISFDESQRNAFLKEVRDLKNGFTDALSSDDWPVRRWEVCGLLFEPGKITHWALARKGNRVATGKVRVEFTEVTPTSIQIDSVKSLMANASQVKIVSARSGIGGAIGEPTWNSLKEAIGQMDEDSLAVLERLERMRVQSRNHIVRPGVEVVAQQRDALGVALDAFDQTGQLRKKTLQSWVAPEGNVLTSFLDGLTGVRTIEDQLIARDAATFPNADERRLTTVGAVFHVGGRTLEVFNLNRTRVEHATGADLLYFHEQCNAWTLVQYKSMERDDAALDKRAVYRPDSTFDSELQRMVDFRQQTPDAWLSADGPNAYRLSGDGFFFKFCSRIQLEVLSDALLPGMYLPREFMVSVLADPKSRGQRGGRILTFENAGRHLTNTLFAELLREGWIGTRGVSSEKIAQIVRDALMGNRSVSVARARPPGSTENLEETLLQIGLVSDAGTEVQI
nr:hypothetical protein [Rhodoferax sp.]